MSIEPIHDRDHYRREASETRAHGDQPKGKVELKQRIDPREPHKPEPKEQGANAQNQLGSIPIDQPPLKGTENPALNAG